MLKRALKKVLRSAGKELASADNLNELRNEVSELRNEVRFYRSLDRSSILYSQLPQEKRELIAPFLPYSKAQLAQDLFALAFTESISPKFFVEFGATDGVSLSNTWLLEKKLGWNGILAEPAKIWHDALAKNRSCSIDTRCVAKTSGLNYQFLEVENSSDSFPELSSVEKFANNGDWASNIRLKNSICYEVETISLDDLLDQHHAPNEIQFLSIDTEGGELEILQSHNFRTRKIYSICVEHNYVENNRVEIKALLLDKGYKQVFQHLSMFDDWYLLSRD